MEIKNVMQLRFLNKSENEILARTCIVSFLTYIDPTISWINELKTAVSEAVTNAVVHAYKEENFIELTAKVLNDQVVVEIKDNGCGIENCDDVVEGKIDIIKKEDRAGMGFQIIKSFVDELKVSSKLNVGTTVILTKKLERDLKK